MEKAVVSAVSHSTDESKLTLLRLPDRPGVAATVFGDLSEAGVNVDMIIQNVSEQGTTDISFTVVQADLPAAQQALDKVTDELGVAYVIGEQMGKVSIIGAGMKSYPGVAAKMFKTTGGREHQHRDDQHLVDQDQLRDRARPGGAGGAGAARGVQPGTINPVDNFSLWLTHTT